MSTEKRDALARNLFGALLANGARTPEEYQAAAERQVDGAIAEALRNAATRLEARAAMYALTGHPNAERDAAIGRGFAAALEADAAALENGPEKPPTEADLRRKLRDYTVNALDTAEVPLDADAAQARHALLLGGLKTYATDAELESFQALRRQIRASQSDYTDSLQVDSLVKTLDRLGAHNQVGPAEIGALLEDAGHSVPLDDVLRAASDIRRARES